LRQVLAKRLKEVPAGDHRRLRLVSAENASAMEASDLELVDRVQNGDTDAFELLVRRYQHRVYNHVSRMIGAGEDAADLTQDVFVKVYRSLNRFRGQASFQTWLYRVTANLCVDRHRRGQRAPQVTRSLEAPLETDSGEVETEVPDWEENPERQMMTRELQQQVKVAILQLSEKLRPVIVMHDLEGHSYEEIAAALQIPLGTVKSRLFNARAALKELLMPYLGTRSPGLGD